MTVHIIGNGWVCKHERPVQVIVQQPEPSETAITLASVCMCRQHVFEGVAIDLLAPGREGYNSSYWRELVGSQVLRMLFTAPEELSLGG